VDFRPETGQTNATAVQAWRTGKVRDWLLAILRFAVTLDQSDRAAVLTMAREMDRSGSNAEPAFAFFLRTSAELCNAIADKDNPKRVAALQSHLKRIDDHRLRRTFQAATEFDPRATVSSRADKRGDLWTGL
jgi:hypothetical protein